MKKKISAITVGIFFFLFCSVLTDLIQKSIDPGFSKNQSGSLILNLLLNLVYYFLSGYLAAFIAAAKERIVSTTLGFALIIILILQVISTDIYKPLYYYFGLFVSALFVPLIGGNYRKKQSGKQFFILVVLFKN